MKRFLILVAVVATGCAEQKTTQPAMRALGQSVKVTEARSDEAIGIDVRQQLDLAGAPLTSSVVIDVSDGVVTLRGSAPSLAAAWRAEAAAHSVKGVKTVINQILVTGGPTMP